jgi:hypothetical protein
VKNADYERNIKRLDWNGLRGLYAQIESRDTPGWDPGKAFEYMVPRVFELDGARVRWPYDIWLHGHKVEQIDGAVQAAGLYCLLECKDEKDSMPIIPVAKMRNQLMRRQASV